MNTKVEQQICDAIEILVNRAIDQADFDKTIQATIVSCVDATIGKYKVKYQDSTFYAYSGSSEITYPNGSTVYILVPGNDTSADKTILGTTKKMGINYVATIEDDEAYQVIGNNVLSSSQSFGLQSYKAGKQVKVLYSKQNNVNQNSIFINQTAVNEYIKNQKTIICGGVVRTNLPTEQQFRGNYGLLFALNFRDNGENSVVTRYYTIDVDKMRGNPYKILYDTRQYAVFDIDGENFIDIESISIFCYNFPNTKPDNQCVDDIFIKDIELCGAERLDEDSINNYSLTFYTPQGIYFDGTSLNSDTRLLQAEVRVKGKVIDNKSQPLPFYWFVEHVGITSESTYYNKYGGQGWKCLNEYNVIKKATSTDPDVVEWIPASHKWTVKKTDVVAKEVKYKCAVVYEGTVITKTIVVKNLNSRYDITIDSSEGTKFYFDIGYPTLRCLVNGREDNSLSYSWAVTNNAGNFESMPDTPIINSEYLTAYNNYHTLLDDIQKERVPLAPNRDRLAWYKAELDGYDKVTRVDRNTIFNLKVSTITNFSTYQCTVYQGKVYLGTASIVLTNSLTAEGMYTMVIHDGSCVYKYDENGVSPASSAVDNPIEIENLTFSIYDNYGKILDDIVGPTNSDIEWLVPYGDDTMIDIPNIYDENSYTIDKERGLVIFKGFMSLAYGIKSRYDITKTRNNIQLVVAYQSKNKNAETVRLSAETDLVFTKEGEAGTNGTDFFCRIVPNTPSGYPVPAYPILTEKNTYDWNLNYTVQQAMRFFRVQLWHDDKKILDSVTTARSTEGQQAKIKWSILRNKYTSTIYDYSSLTVGEETGVFTYSGYSSMHPAHIVKAEVEYDGVTYYATMPLITVKLANNNYKVDLKTGFRNVLYSSDGKSPRYDNSNPFELTVYQKVSGYDEDVSLKTTSTYSLTYEWTYLGWIHENGAWIEDLHLSDAVIKIGATKNQKYVKPNDNYDGQCVTNGLQCIIKKSGTEVARIHIPIHMLLNRYGNSAINGWDGNSVNVNKNEGFILAPQVGAGIKEADNSFTGVLIGKVKETDRSGQDVGLIGYSKGVRSILLDADDGSAVFGTKNNGKVIIDPTQNKAMLYSWNYWKNYNSKGKPSSYGSGNVNDKGMLINLTDSLIHLGSAESGKIYSGAHTSLGSTQVGFYLSHDGLSIGKGFVIATDGKSEVTHEGSNIGNWRVKTDASGNAVGIVSRDGTGIFLDSETSTIVLGSSAGKIYSGAHTSIDDTDTGFYLSQEGLSIVSKKNNQTSKFVLKTNDTPVMYSNGHSTIDSNQPGFYLGQDGLAITNRWTEGSNTFTSSLKMKTSGNPEIYSNGHDSLTNTRDGFYLGNSGLSIGSKVYIDKTGVMRLGNGAVANNSRHWEISGDTTGDKNSYIKYGNMNDTNSVYISTGMIALGKKFYVDNTGVMRIGSGAVAADGTYWTINGDGTKSYIAYGGTSWSEANSDSSDNTKIYLGTDGISLGHRFSVSRQGELKAYSGEIGGWTITRNKLAATDGHMELQANGTLKGGSSYSWSINSAGTATFNRLIADTGGKIAGWNITSSGLYNSTESIHISTSGMVFGSNFSVTADGTLTANNGVFSGKITSGQGSIGGWAINATTLTGGAMTLNSNGSMSGTGWSIETGGKANFSNINVTGGSITLGGSTLNASGTKLTAANTKVGSQSLKEYIEELAVGRLTANDVTITASLNVGNNNYYLRMGQGTNNPEVSGLNVGAKGIRMNNGKSGQTHSIGFVSSIDDISVSVHKGSIVGITTPLITSVTVKIDFKTRSISFYDGIHTEITDASGDSKSDTGS